MTLRLILLTLAASVALSGCFPFGQAAYTYEGEPLVSIQNDDPPAGEYLAGDRVRGFIALPADLGPDLGGSGLADVTDRIVTFFFTDGRSDLNARNATMVEASIRTDGSGDIVAWRMVVEDQDGTRTIETESDATALDRGTIEEGGGADIGETDASGSWTRLGFGGDFKHDHDHGRDHDDD